MDSNIHLDGRSELHDELRSERIDESDLDIASAYAESNSLIPFVCLVSPNVDPVTSVMNFASTMGFSGPRFNSLSLGEDQGTVAAKMIEEAMKNGTWVLLQNCHLAEDWMPALDKICETLDSDNTHVDFRLWLTTCLFENFPINILQNSVKLAFGEASDFKKNISRCLTNSLVGDVELFENPKVAEKFRKVVFALCFFHSITLERKQFSSLCWNYEYNFDDIDLRCSVEHVQQLLSRNDNFQFGLLQYLIPECNYGGKIMDEWDQRCLNFLFDKYLTPRILESENYTYDTQGRFFISNERDLDMILSKVKKFPHTPSSDIVGVNNNAIVGQNAAKTEEFLSRVLICQDLVIKPVLTQEETEAIYSEVNDTKVCEKASDILSKLPPAFSLKAVMERYQFSHEETMNTIFLQEVTLYNRLLNTIHISMSNILKAIKGEMVMRASLDDVYKSILKNTVPSAWFKNSYPSLKSLGSYVSDFLERLTFLQRWFDIGTPESFWISGFFRPESFLTGVLQNFAHKNSLFVKDLGFDFKVILADPESLKTSTSKTEGVIVHGLFLEGARWDSERMILEEALPSMNHSQFPMLALIPGEKSDLIMKSGKYACPLYRTCNRRSLLVDCQHSPNFVTTIILDTDKPEEHWALRGVALLTQLSD